MRGIDDKITGLFRHVNGVSGEGLRFDGETTSIVRPAQEAPQISDGLSVEAWIAINTYPWNWVPIIDQSRGEEESRGERGYSVGIDAFGHLGLRVAINGEFKVVTAKDALPLKKWSHIAATYDSGGGLKLFVNDQLAAELAAQGPITPAAGQDLVIGRVREATLPLEWIHPKFAVWYSFDGIIDELHLYNRSLSDAEIACGLQPDTSHAR